MATIEVPQPGQDPLKDVKESFSAGPETSAYTGPAPMTPEQEEIEKDRMMKIMKRELPLLRMRQEYDEAQLKIIESSVLLGQRPITSVPGLQGLELQVREIKARQFLVDFNNEMQQMHDQMEQEKKAQEQKDKEAADKNNLAD